MPAPYLAANRPLIDLGELALVQGFGESVIVRLRPFVTALPRFTAINANTAPAEVLAAVIDELGLDGARDLVSRRDQGYFRDFDEFFKQLPPGLVVPTENITVSSSFFLATLRVTIADAQARGEALLLREATGWPAVVWHKTL
jgi:general secretion pathway protein K